MTRGQKMWLRACVETAAAHLKQAKDKRYKLSYRAGLIASAIRHLEQANNIMGGAK